MHGIDWAIFVGFLGYVIWDGIRQSSRNREADDYFVAGRTVPWWAIGLSIMATQASAITMVGTSGQGWYDGLRFVQFYYALPLAMIILALVAVPAYHRLQVRTAYEYLGKRFDGKTRVLSAVLFLILRGLSVGFVIYTPALVLAKVFNFPLKPTILFMGVVAVIYTSIGGLRAVIATDVKQMTVMVLGLIVAFVSIVKNLPPDVGWSGAMRLADATGRLEVANWSWDPKEKYTIWSSLIGGLFLFLSYFGTDQSQTQRLFASKSVRHAQAALLLNAVCKVPFQFLVLTCGVLLFSFYIFQDAPISFVPGADRIEVTDSADPAAYTELLSEYDEARVELQASARALLRSDEVVEVDASRFRDAAEHTALIREQARELRSGGSDRNFVFLHFILNHLPIGLVGLLLAAIFAAALSSIDSEINAMSTVAVVDIYGFLGGKKAKDSTMIAISRWMTLLVGGFATAFAVYADIVGSLVEAVNNVGSYIYGSLLGVFVLGLVFPRANGHGAFAGLITGMIVVVWAAQTGLAFLYLNTVGTFTVVAVGILVSLATMSRRAQA